MMIRQNHSHPSAPGICDLASCRNTIVTGHDGINSIFRRLIDQLLMKSISVFDSVRNTCISLCPQSFQTFQQNTGRRHAINIVITNDTDFFIFCNFHSQNFHSFIHIFHKPW